VSIWDSLSRHFGSIFHEKAFQKSMSFLIHLFIDFGIDLEAQMAPKTFQNSLKNQLKIRPRNLSQQRNGKRVQIFAWVLPPCAIIHELPKCRLGHTECRPGHTECCPAHTECYLGFTEYHLSHTKGCLGHTECRLGHTECRPGHTIAVLATQNAIAWPTQNAAWATQTVQATQNAVRATQDGV